MQKKLEITDFVSEIKRVENDLNFEKLPHVTIQHGLQERRKTILVFVEVSLVISNVANVFTKRNPT